MPDEEPKKPKIIIDEDWKTQVDAEREALRDAESTADAGDASAADAGDTGAQTDSPAQPETESAGSLPPASLATLVSSLATQALAAMGGFPDAEGNPLPPNPEIASHLIDTLAMLQEKTQGNRSDEESQLLEQVVNEMRMIFISMKKSQ